MSRSTYTYVHPSGISHEMRLTLDANVGDRITIGHIVVNPVIPFHFSLIRVFGMLLFCILIYMYRPQSPWYRIEYNRKKKWQRLVVTLFVLIQIAVFGMTLYANADYISPDEDGYQNLAESLADGSSYIQEEASSVLEKMNNPYDPVERNAVLEREGGYAKWDFAYYKGHYYWYFGIVPELLLYLPYFLLTHSALPTLVAIFILESMLIMVIPQFIRIILEKWFPRTSFMLYMLVTAGFINMTGLLFVASRPVFYVEPITAGILFALLGLSFWIKSIQQDGTINKLYITIGSLCIALVAGCRPQLVLVAFAAFPLFWDSLVHKRELFSKKSSLTTILSVIPFVVVAAVLMYYNWKRFDSVFDFGANYNLTSNDMTHKVISLEKMWQGLYLYLFQIIPVSIEFPYFKQDMNLPYMGLLIRDGVYGGVLIYNMMLWTLPLQVKLKSIHVEKSARVICMFVTVMGVVIAAADTLYSGVLFRYMSDFMWFFGIAAIIIIFAVSQHMHTWGNGFFEKYWRMFIVWATIETILYNALLMFTSPSAFEENPELFYRIVYLLDVWI